MAIPRLIYQTAKCRANLPPVFELNIDHLKALNKNWTYRFFEDGDIEDFIRDVYGREVLAIYHRISALYGAARADLFRYLLLYETGGVYLDIKSSATQALDSVLLESDDFILSHWPQQAGHRHAGWGRHPGLSARGEYQNWHIIAAPRHPFLRRVIDQVLLNIKSYNPAKNGVGKMAVLRLTGPIAYTKAIHGIQDRHSWRYVDSEALGLRYSVVETPSNLRAHERAFEKHYTELTTPICLADFDLGQRSWSSVSRNESCPCGSGQRYKNCHGKLT